MGATKKPRKAYKPRDVMATPLPWGTTNYMARSIGLRIRAEVDAVINHQATSQHVDALSAECVSLAALVDISRERPDECPLTSESLAAVGDEIYRIAGSVAGIKARRDETGKIGVNGQERADLLALADVYDQMMQVMPRRLWHDAYQRAIDNPQMQVAA